MAELVLVVFWVAGDQQVRMVVSWVAVEQDEMAEEGHSLWLLQILQMVVE